MWAVEKEFRFEASHQLPRHAGKCNRLHGHSWVGRMICESESLQTSGSQSGMVMDFSEMKEAITPILEKYLDHWHLNETTSLENPTAEELARWIYHKVKPALPKLVAVAIDETCTSRAVYRP